MRLSSEIPRPSSRETAMPPCWASAGANEAPGTVCASEFRKERLVLNGPRRAQAASHLPSSIGPMPEAKASARTIKQAHAVTSRVTSWAFWFSRLARFL